MTKNRKKSNKQKYISLGLAFFALSVNFWAWSILSPLASRFGDELNLEPVSLAVLLAIPVIVGALGRIPLGALTDKYGGRLMFSIVSLLTIIPVVGLAYAQTYQQFILPAIFLGLGGATFAIGIPFVNTWFEPKKRGFALGIYSMGNAGTALSGFLTPHLTDGLGRKQAYLLVAGILLVIALLMLIFGRNSPNWTKPKGSALSRIVLAGKMRNTWDLSVLYAVSFGAFVAFGVYLPMLLKVSFDLSLSDAAARAGGFILLATIARPIGGWLSDKFGGQNVVRLVFVGITVLSAFVAFQTTLNNFATVSYLSLAFVLGCGNGAIIALVSKLNKPEVVGSVTGIVGACGGLGGFLPPLVMGLNYQKASSYTLSLIMLSVVASLVFIYINRRFRYMGL